MKIQFTVPFLIIVRGIPGSGKTSIARELAKTLGSDIVQAVDPDEVDSMADDYRELSRSLSAQGVDEKFHTYRYLNAKARHAIDTGKLIIWNQAFIDFKGLTITIERLKEYANEQNFALPILVVNVLIDAAVAKRRIEERAAHDGRIIEDEVMARFVRDYKPYEGTDYLSITVQGVDSVSQSVASIVDAIKT